VDIEAMFGDEKWGIQIKGVNYNKRNHVFKQQNEK
jgi:hypothetical protein